ncbi:MAG: hypothetical protein H6Q89_2142, partial [Myxococcaceae bacterium]|nr:hypothetical protein [Myxococcaceae bacterium]
MTVGKATRANRKPITTGCGAGTGKVSGDKKPARPAVSTGCGASGGGGWKPSTKPKAGGKTTGLSERTASQLDKAKSTADRKAVSTGCGASTPSRPAPKPKPAPKTVSTGCGASTPSRPAPK